LAAAHPPSLGLDATPGEPGLLPEPPSDPLVLAANGTADAESQSEHPGGTHLSELHFASPKP
jgi:hypothetical protein